MSVEEFEKKVTLGLEKCGVHLSSVSEDFCFGAAVSGGADSVSLLVSLSHICKKNNIPLKVITVNHFIRPDEETCGDVEYVKNLCSSLNICCRVSELEKGSVLKLAEKKGTGVEDAARQLRYEAFEKFIDEEKISVLCLAHNRNDQLETAVMRFLQGTGVDAGKGISACRGKYIRPLLEIPRNEIENYLYKQNLNWRTDSTNEDTLYLRNKIRKELMPFLNEKFPGWDKAVLTGTEKAFEDGEIIQKELDEYKIEVLAGGEIARIDARDFYKAPAGIQKRLILKAANLLGFNQRIPYVFIKDVCETAEKLYGKTEKWGGVIEKHFSVLQICMKNNEVLLKKHSEIQNEIIFSAIIEESGIYEGLFGSLFIPENINFPVLLRSWQLNDEILTADGKYKKVSDIFSDWHVPEAMRQYIPVVQELNSPEQNIVCVLGSHLGYKNWIVKTES